MGEKRILFITINNPVDKEPSEDLMNELNQYLNWINSKVKDDTIILVSPLVECMYFGKIIGTTYSKSLFSVLSLTTKSDLTILSQQLDLSDFNKLDESHYGVFINKDNLLSYAYETGCNYIVILETSVFMSYDLTCASRSKEATGMHEYILNEMYTDRKNPEEETKYQIINTVRNLRKDIEESLESELPIYTRQVENITEEIKSTVFLASEYAVCINDLLKKPRKNYLNFKNQLKIIKESLKKSQEYTSGIQQTVKMYNEMIDANPEDPPEYGLVEIRKFQYDMHLSQWILKIKSTSPKPIRNIIIYNIENKEKIHTFKYLEANSSTTAFICISFFDYVSNNLIATYKGNFISHVFPVYPYYISVSKIEHQDGSIAINIVNTSFHYYNNLALAVSNKTAPISLGDKIIGYKESIQQEVKVEDVQGGRLFLIANGEIISNKLIFH
ncbi:hypothetical protein SteCoe_13086 [Stentor coeruleus]|uniref:Uncharacterized protein n=1 Tax=Stentor coeruleus TaxID=5963 RepID=A0A1R2C964_9CILI|nr:hypothetical protein SteCoe_13086 [Stentor coeruleus]